MIEKFDMNHPKTDSMIPWARFGVEAVLIVASILVAFAIDAWWDSRSARMQEIALLNSLSQDFEEAASEFDRSKSVQLLIARAGETLITYSEVGSVPIEERERFDLLISQHFARYTFDSPTGTVDSAIGSGKINLLSNQRLVAELTQWSAAVEEVRQLQTDARAHFYTRIYPYLASRYDLEDMDKGYPQFVDNFPWQQDASNAYDLVSDREFMSIIYMHWVISTNILTALGVVEEAITNIRDLIDAELTKNRG